MAEDLPRPVQRIGDRERDAIVALLQRAVSEGRLSLDELDSRLEVAMGARTYADLVPVVADLSDAPWPLQLSGTGSVMRRPPPPGYSPTDPLRLDGAVKRVGAWNVPPFIQINHGSRWVRLDFQQATTDSTVIDVEVIGGAGFLNR